MQFLSETIELNQIGNLKLEIFSLSNLLQRSFKSVFTKLRA